MKTRGLSILGYNRAMDAFEARVNELNGLVEGQAAVNADLRKENERLKKLDSALKDFNFKLYEEARAKLAKEGFDMIKHSRPVRYQP